MKQIIFLLALLMSFLFSSAQTGDVRGARGIFSQSVFIGSPGTYGRYIDSILNDTSNLDGKVRSVMTANAVYDLINGRISLDRAFFNDPNLYNSYTSNFKGNSWNIDSLGGMRIKSVNGQTRFSVDGDKIEGYGPTGKGWLANSDSLYEYGLSASLNTNGLKVRLWNPVSSSNTYIDPERIGPAQSVIGQMYAANSWTNLDTFTYDVGATIVSNKINFTGGTGVFDSLLSFKEINGLEKWIIEMKVIVNEKDGDSWGFGLGTKSINSAGGGYGTQAMFAFDMTSGVSTGKITFRASTGAGGFSTYATSVGALTNFSVGDTILFSVERDREIMTAKAKNLATGVATDTVSLVYTYPYYTGPPYAPNTGKLSVFNVGGDFTIDSLGLASSEIQYPSFMVIGDSKASGGNVTDRNQRFVTLMNNGLGPTVVNAGQGDKTGEVIQIIPQVINKVKPRTILLTAMSNDIRTSVSSAVWQANYDSMENAYRAAGINVYHVLPFKENMSQVAWVNFIRNTYSADSIIDAYTPSLECTGCQYDGIHQGDKGHLITYKAIEKRGLPGATHTGQEYYHLRNEFYTLPQKWTSYITGRFQTGDSLVGNALRTVAGASFYNDKLKITNSGFGTSPRLETLTYMNIRAGSDITTFEGSTNRAVIQLQTVGAQSISGEIRGWNNFSGFTNAPLRIYTGGTSNSAAGNIVIQAGETTTGGGIPTGGFLGTYDIVLLPSSNKVKIRPPATASISDSLLFFRASDSSIVKMTWDSLLAHVAGSAGSYTFENGLTESGGNVKLGGLLTENTTIDGDGGLYDLTITDVDDLTINGTGGILGISLFNSVSFESLSDILLLADDSIRLESSRHSVPGLSYHLPDSSLIKVMGYNPSSKQWVYTNWAYAGGGGGMTNPMTTEGDIIYGSTSGTPERLGIGTNGDVLTVVEGLPVWQAPVGGSGSDNANVGSGYRWLKPGTQEIKTAFGGYGITIDSSSNTNGLTHILDTATVFPAIRSTIPGGGGSPAGNFGNLQINRNSAFATPGSDSLNWTSTGLDSKGQFRAYTTTTGTVTAPTYASLSDPNTGWNNSGSDILSVVVNGIHRWGFNAQVLIGDANAQVGFNSTVNGAFGGGASVALQYGGAAGLLQINNGTSGTYRDLIGRSFTMTGGVKIGYVAKTGNYTLTATDNVVSNTSGSNTMTLPTAVGATGQQYTITNTDAGATVTIATTSSQTFVNVTATPTSLTIAALGSRTVVSNGANWLLIAQ